MTKTCAYCGDEAVFGRLDGEGRVACPPCVGLLAVEIEPDSPRHAELRPYFCAFCNKRTAGEFSCGRGSCIEQANAGGGTN